MSQVPGWPKGMTYGAIDDLRNGRGLPPLESALDREIALRRTLVQVADALERAAKADDDERSILFHISLIGKLCRDAEFVNETSKKVYRNIP